MKRLEFGAFSVDFDDDATRAAYHRLSQGGANVCACDSCENFAAQRETAYPEKFVAVLRSLGIDPSKENEAYECGRDETGLHLYGGWLHFIGAVVRVGDEIEIEGFRYWFDDPGHAPQPDVAFAGVPVSAIEFMTHLPWIIDKPEPD